MPWFPEQADHELERLADLIFDLRRHIFSHEVYRPAHEREWETDAQEKQRDERNEERLRDWDNETRRLILGEQSVSSGDTT